MGESPVNHVIRVLDVETCGLEAADGVCEIGWTDLTLDTSDVAPIATIGETQSQLIDPGRKIPPGMSAIHHIIDDMVRDAPTLLEFLPTLDEPGVTYAAHHASFERSFLCGEPPLIPMSAQWICTWKAALNMAPRAPTHTNQGLRYYLRLSADSERASPPHRAGPDSYITACLLARMLAKATVAELVEISSQPAIMPYLTFGEHQGKPISTVPGDYLGWIMKKGQKKPGNDRGFDEDVRATVNAELMRRRQGGQ